MVTKITVGIREHGENPNAGHIERPGRVGQTRVPNRANFVNEEIKWMDECKETASHFG